MITAIFEKLFRTAPPVAALLLVSARALAQEAEGGGGDAGGGGDEGGGVVSFFNFGFIYSHAWGELTSDGLGVEASFAIYPPKTAINFGFFGQGQIYSATAEASPDKEGGFYGRTAAGIQFAFGGFGMEGGWAYMSPAVGLPSTHAVHIGHFLSCGFLVFSPRVTMPVGSLRETEFALTAGIKLPVLMSGDAASKFPAGAFVGKAPPPPRGMPLFARR